MFINPFKTCNFKGIKWKCIELNLGSFFKMAKPSGSKFNSFKKAITSQVGAESEGGSITSKTTHFACNIHPSLDIVNEPVRPLWFTISSHSLYQGIVKNEYFQVFTIYI